MLREGKRYSVAQGQFLNEETWSRRKSVVTVLPPTIGPVPLVNDQILRADSRRGSTVVSRQRSALAAARRKSSVMGGEKQFVYLVDPQQQDPVAQERKQRMLKALLTYESPRPQFANATFDRRGSADFSNSIDEEPTPENKQLQPFRAFEAVDSGSSEDDDEEFTRPVGSPLPAFAMTVESPRKASTPKPSSPRRLVPSLSIPNATPRVSSRVAADQRRKSLKALLTVPNDILSGLGTIEDTLDALDDDKKLLGLEEQAEAMMSARQAKSSRRHKERHNSPSVSGFSSPRTTPRVEIPELPEVVMPSFESEIREALQHFTPLETMQELLNTVTETILAMKFDHVQLFHSGLAAFLTRQRDVVLAAVDASRTLLNDVVLPKAVEQTKLLQVAQSDLLTEKRTSTRSKGEMSKIQAALRQYGIVPARWGVLPPPAESCCILCCDFPTAAPLWNVDVTSVRNAIKCVVELERKLIKEMKCGYEVVNYGTSLILAFATPRTAVDWALAFQAQLIGLSWPHALLQLPTCEADAKLLWKGLRARISIHSGATSTYFDAETQGTIYYGEALRVSSSLMTFCPPGIIVASDEVLRDVGDLKNLATHGGAFGVQCTAELEGSFFHVTRLTPHALKGRLDRIALESTQVPKPSEAAFLMQTLRPSDNSRCDALVNGKGGDPDGARQDQQVCVTNEFAFAQDEDEETLKQLNLCLNLHSLPEASRKILNSVEQAAISVVTVFVQVVDAARAFAKHQASLLSTIRTLLKCVRRAVKGLASGTDVACVGETVSLIFASRTDAMTFIDRFLSHFYGSQWHEDTLKGWALAFPGENATPDVVIGAHFAPIRNYERDVSFDIAQRRDTEVYASVDGSNYPLNHEGSLDSSTLLSGYARNFDVACALAAFALPGEIIFSSAMAESCGGLGHDARNLSFVELGLFSIQHPRYEGTLFAGSSTSNQKKMSSNKSGSSSVHSSVSAEGVSWPSSKTVQALSAWLPMVQETFHANQRAMSMLMAERTINQMRRPPNVREAIFVAVEAYVPRAMWQNPKKFLILEALKSFQRCVRGLLTELDDGYEVFTDPQCFFLAFRNQQAAFKFSVGVQDKLASMFWSPTFVEEFKSEAQRVAASDGTLLWSGLKARVAMVTPPGATSSSVQLPQPEVFSDVMSTNGATIYFGRAVQWCIQLCSVASWGQTIIDQDTTDAMQSFLPLLGDPVIDSLGPFYLPGRQGPMQVFSVRSQLLKSRIVPNEGVRSQSTEEGSIAGWFSQHTKEDSSVQYVLDKSAGEAASISTKVARSNSLLPTGLFETLQVQESMSFNPPNERSYTAGGSHTPNDPFARSAASDTGFGLQPSGSTFIQPLPSVTQVTPRNRRQSTRSPTPRQTESALVDPSEFHEVQDELTRCHKVVKRLLELEQNFARAYIFKESVRGFKSEEDFTKSIVATCRELGVRWHSSDSKHIEKSFLALSNAVLPGEPSVGSLCNALSGGTSGQVSRTNSGVPQSMSGGKGSRGDKDQASAKTPAQFTASVAGLLCHFHTFIARVSRMQRKTSLVGSEHASPQPTESVRSRKSISGESSIVMHPKAVRHQSVATSHTSVQSSSSPGSHRDSTRSISQEIGARAVSSDDDESSNDEDY